MLTFKTRNFSHEYITPKKASLKFSIIKYKGIKFKKNNKKVSKMK